MCMMVHPGLHELLYWDEIHHHAKHHGYGMSKEKGIIPKLLPLKYHSCLLTEKDMQNMLQFLMDMPWCISTLLKCQKLNISDDRLLVKSSLILGCFVIQSISKCPDYSDHTKAVYANTTIAMKTFSNLIINTTLHRVSLAFSTQPVIPMSKGYVELMTCPKATIIFKHVLSEKRIYLCSTVNVLTPSVLSENSYMLITFQRFFSLSDTIHLSHQSIPKPRNIAHFADHMYLDKTYRKLRISEEIFSRWTFATFLYTWWITGDKFHQLFIHVHQEVSIGKWFTMYDGPGTLSPTIPCVAKPETNNTGCFVTPSTHQMFILSPPRPYPNVPQVILDVAYSHRNHTGLGHLTSCKDGIQTYTSEAKIPNSVLTLEGIGTGSAGAITYCLWEFSTTIALSLQVTVEEVHYQGPVDVHCMYGGLVLYEKTQHCRERLCGIWPEKNNEVILYCGQSALLASNFPTITTRRNLLTIILYLYGGYSYGQIRASVTPTQCMGLSNYCRDLYNDYLHNKDWLVLPYKVN